MMNLKHFKPTLLCAITILLLCNIASAQYNETTPASVQAFLDELPDSTWGGACGSYSRYTFLEAEKVNLSLGEVTIRDYDHSRVRRTVCCGHRVNYFWHNGTRYYVDNIHDRGRILRYWELQPYILRSFGINLTRVGFKNWKPPKMSRGVLGHA